MSNTDKPDNVNEASDNKVSLSSDLLESNFDRELKCIKTQYGCSLGNLGWCNGTYASKCRYFLDVGSEMNACELSL